MYFGILKIQFQIVNGTSSLRPVFEKAIYR